MLNDINDYYDMRDLDVTLDKQKQWFFEIVKRTKTESIKEIMSILYHIIIIWVYRGTCMRY